MTLDEIRRTIADSTAATWHTLSSDAPTYIGRFVDYGPDRRQEYIQHDLRAVYQRDLDIGLAWGMTADPHHETTEPHWTAGRLQPATARSHVVEVLYRGQPADREVYASVDNGHGVVPWPQVVADGALQVTRWQVSLVELLRELGVSVGAGSVESYMRRLDFTVAG